MNYVFNIESGLFTSGELDHEIAKKYRYYRDVLHADVHIITEQGDLQNVIQLALNNDLNTSGFMFVRVTGDKRSDSEVIAEYVDAIGLEPANTIEIYDNNNAGWWIENGFNVIEAQ
ncbi:hypothetical protein I3271_05650 [Photobacterium leiognathi]|uniref:hypothetical protein n=1 Tax=Photobacterium leiognathi TaxID=553611 RepID=UPI001EDEF035|nr:hypothetical protein [Photobacterium leiognathi]MCG3884166.1 hypothetical protein [Photobacterium leiognathi]